MPNYPMSEMTRQGVRAARAGDEEGARQLLIAAARSDDEDVAAWWWLAQVIGDPKARHKCLQKAQAVAAESETARAIYKELLRESGAPSLPRYRLTARSGSVGDQCPICTVQMTASEEIVVCPGCGRANHRECWEENVFHCGNFACDGAALVDASGPVRNQVAAKSQVIQLDSSDIPDTTPWLSRETQEAGFVNRLSQRAAEVMAARWLQAGEERLLQAQLELLNQAVAQRAGRAFFVGLLPGALLAYLSFRFSQSWVIALFTVYLTASCLSAAAASSFMDARPVVSVLYWTLPQVLTALMMWLAYGYWGGGSWWSGLAAVIVGCVTSFIVKRILITDAFHNRRTFVAISAWLLGVVLFVLNLTPKSGE